MTSYLQPANGLVVSVVSHGHGPLVHALLADLARFCTGSVGRVVLTLNLPEADPEVPLQGWPFNLQVRRNVLPLGFGANHNRALDRAHEPFVCVLNPDVELNGKDPFAALVRAAALPSVGCAYPSQLNAHGELQDSERELPTLGKLLQRRLLRRKETQVDWVNAACLVLPQTVWQALGGFDEGYFMYCEDVDLCLRLRLKGLQLVLAPAQILHAGQRASHRRWSHLKWHVRSMLRLWRSPAYRQARQLLRAQRKGTGNIAGS